MVLTPLLNVIFVFTLVCIAPSSLALFPENPADFYMDGNIALFSAMFFSSGTGNLKVAWQQREKNLVGELGYTTDLDFSTAYINYKLTNVTGRYGADLRFKVMPVEEFSFEIDAGVSVAISKELKASLGVYELSLYAPAGQPFKVPTFVSELRYEVNKNFAAGLLLRNFASEFICVGLELSLSDLLPLSLLAVSYAPIYRWTDGAIWNVFAGVLKLAFQSFTLSVSGFYNLDGTIGPGRYLDSNLGGRVELGVRF